MNLNYRYSMEIYWNGGNLILGEVYGSTPEECMEKAEELVQRKLGYGEIVDNCQEEGE